MSSIIFRVPLTSEEKLTFNEQFRALDKEQLGILTGETLKTLFAQSGLSAQQLSQIWSICDTDNTGFLNVDQFNAAMRMIGHLQVNPTQPITLEVYQTPAPKLPTFLNNSSASVPRMPQAPIRTISVSDTGSSSTYSVIPVCVPQDYAKFSQLFDRSTDGSGQLPGNKAREFFLKAKLPTPTLGTIWELCDRNNKGHLDKAEFVMAMHLIQLTLQHNPSVLTLPSSLPNYLWNSLSTTASSTITPLSANSTGFSFNSNSGSTQRHSSIARKPSLSMLSTGTFSNAAVDWTLTAEKKKQFDAIFDSLDKEKRGSLGSDVLVPFFLTSKLGQDVLATVWDLADIHNSPVFTKIEFAIAMFLIQKKNSGHELPDVVPDQLLHSPVLGLYVQQPTQQHSAPVIPSRDTKPTYQELTAPPVQVQQTNNSALDDLLGLNSSFSPSSAHSTSQANVTAPIASSSTGYRKFRPTSTFGQTIVQEESSTPQLSADQNQTVEKATALPKASTSSAAQSVPQVSNKHSTLPTVPIFAAVPSQSRAVNTVSYSSAPSADLSQSTTELANLSNQVSSLTTQATKVHEEKIGAQTELNRIISMKSSIESKLITLRASYDEEVRQTEELQSQLVNFQKENETLTQQAAVAEANYHAVQTQSQELAKQLEEAQEENSHLKQRIAEFNTLSTQLQETLVESQENVKQEKSKVDVHSKQLEMSEITVSGLQTEIAGLEQNLSIYLSKHKELDDYKTTIENQHSEMENKHQQLLAKSEELQSLEQEIQTRTVQIQEQENIYRGQVLQLQKMFDDLNARKSDFEKANSDLERQQYEYADKIQKFSESQMKFAMGEMPDDEYTKDILERKSQAVIPAPSPEEEKQESLFDNETPTALSQSEVGEQPQNLEEMSRDETAAQAMAATFEGNLNEYDIPRPESITSSTANNAPLSVRSEVPSNPKEQASLALSQNAIDVLAEEGKEAPPTSIESENMPGGWSDESPSQANDADIGSDSDSIQKTPELVSSDVTGSRKTIDEEFPPIQELHINESDSSEDEEEEKESSIGQELTEQEPTEEEPSQQEPSQREPSQQEPTEQEPTEQEPTEQELVQENSTETPTSLELGEQFEEIDHHDLESNVFHDADPNLPIESESSKNAPVGNDEWDEIFSGLGNNSNTPSSKPDPLHSAPLQHPVPTVASLNASITSKSPVNRGIAVTPKSLAIEELSSMGFTKEEATNALEKCDWDLDDATNMLLDGA